MLLITGLLVGCRNSGANPTETSATAWPTLAPVLSPMPDGAGVPAGATGPQLIDKFRADVTDGTMSLYPLEGLVDQPVRVEVIVLQGDLDPVIEINNSNGDQLALANSGGRGEPEVIGQFQFPIDGYYELAIGALEGSGQVGVSIYRLEKAAIAGGGVFGSIDEELQGRMTQPASYHIFRLEAERGKRFDITAKALTPELDLAFNLYNPDGALVEARDDTEGNDPVLWNFMPRQTGTYTIALTNVDEHTGDYSLKVSPSVSGGEAVIGSRGDLTLSGSPRKSTWLTFSVRSMDVLRIEARTLDPAVDIEMGLYDQYGNRLAFANEGGTGADETLAFVQLPFEGAYQVEFETLSDSGDIQYVIRTSRPTTDDLGGRIAPSNFARKGEMLETGTVISYDFDLNAGDLLSVAARAVGAGNTLDLGFDIYDPDGSLLSTHDDDVGKNPVIDRIEVSLSGRYVVTLWNYAGTVGPFEIVIDSPKAPEVPSPNSGDP